MPVVFCGICPHPPIMVPEVGGKRASEVACSQQAMFELGRRLGNSGAETIVMISPHAPVFRDGIAINLRSRLAGDLRQFGAGAVSLNLENDLPLAREIGLQAARLGVTIIEMEEKLAQRHQVSLELDHGLIVPLYFVVRAGVKLPLVAVSMGFLPEEELYAFGAAISQAADRLKKKVAVLASGDLSHRLTRDAPAGYDLKGREFDQKIVDLVSKADRQGILRLDKRLAERAGECGWRSIIMMLGALDGLSVQADVLSYEGPFGVGYLVAALVPGEPEPEAKLLEKFLAQKKQELEEKRAKQSFLVRVARRTLENYYAAGKYEHLEEKDIPPEFTGKAGVFVSLKKHGHLRGCIGTIIGQRKNIVEEVIHNAISAATRDPRFYPVEKEELEDLTCSVDVLGPPEPVSGLEELDPGNYGVIVRSGSRSGLLLPDLEGIDTAEEQVAIARQKAGIGPDEPVQLQRFKVERYT